LRRRWCEAFDLIRLPSLGAIALLRLYLLTLTNATIQFFLGLVVVTPVLGHATWHLYRSAIGQLRFIPV
tara:strand:+ start:203 stop:409 length:207 start_codon:yes stop_codon:yes gene_type:complete